MSGCCPSSCACEDWLTTFCDYIEVSHRYCGTVTTFEKARAKSVPVEAVRVDAGINPADRIFEFSSLEHEFESGIGAVVLDENEVEWVVYKVERIRSFCITRVWGRNIESCFALLGRIEVYEAIPCATDCGDSGVTMRHVGRLRGNVLMSGGSQSFDNDSDQMSVRYSAVVARWPFGSHPKANHRLKVDDVYYRVSSFTDGGPFVPYSLTLSKVDAGDCQI